MLTTLFVDIGGVLGTNGWDRRSRTKAVDTFQLDQNEFERRHHQISTLFETGAITLDDYLAKTVFYQPRSFSKEDFIAFMQAESNPDLEMLDLIRHLKAKYNLRVAITSNESRELADYRIKLFDLKAFVDTFFVSAFIYLQKPDPRFYKLALEVCQVKPEEVLCIDDRPENIQAAAALGIPCILHRSLEETKRRIVTDASFNKT